MRFTTLASIMFLAVFGGPAFAKEASHTQGSIAVKGKEKSEYATLAKISIQTAIANATSNSKGKVIEAGLDKKDGFLVYEIEILMPDNKVSEVFIDAGNGKILSTQGSSESEDKDEEENDND